MASLRFLLGLSILCLWCEAVTAQNNTQVLPPGGNNSVTYATNSSDTTTTLKPQLSTTTTPVPQQTQKPPRCTLLSVYPVRDTLEGFLISGAKLVELDLDIHGYDDDFLDIRMLRVFEPYRWIRSTGRQGRSLLVLEDNYAFMSLSFLSIGVFRMNVTVTDSPKKCLRTLSPEELMSTIRHLLLNDFKPYVPGQPDASLSVDEHVCNREVKDNDGYAAFVYTCCRKGPDGAVYCEEVTKDEWIGVLMAFIVITKVLVVLYSPSFLPGSLYRLKYVALEYIYRIPDTSPAKRVKMVVTQFPQTYGNDDKVVKLADVKGMEYFKTMVDTNMQLDRIYQVTFDRIRLSVKIRRLLSENYVPVGLLKVLYNNLLRCRIRRLEPLTDCCNTSILGRLNPGVKVLKWYACVKALAKLILLFILILPWIVRVWVYFEYENDSVHRKKTAAERLDLRTSFHGSLTLYLTPLHGFFVIIYIIMIIDSLVYGVLSKPMKEKFKMVLRKCLRDMRERSRIEVCSWATRLFVMPFQMFGIVGLLLFLPYLVLVLPLALPVAAFYLIPALNLTVRLIIHFFIFMCPAKFTEKWERFAARFTKVKEQLNFNKITAEETFEKGNKFTRKDIIIQIIIILMVLVSFWSLTFLLMEVVSFFVEMAVYTLMGIIVNAGATMQYITVGFLILMYGRSTFNDVHKTYLTYHKKIHALLLGMKREEINEIARKEPIDQENTALRVKGEMAAPAEGRDVRLVVKDGRPQWQCSSVLMFLDRQDTPYTPEKFFYDAINLNYCGAPGPLYSHFLYAFWSFGRILLFLFFVFVVVMAFGDAYKVSTTNQLLATVAGGFVPFLFRFIFSASGVPSLYTDSIQFLTQFHLAINRFKQNWPVYDIIPIEFGEVNIRDSVLLNSTTISGDQPPPPSANHNAPLLDASGVEPPADEERIEIEEEAEDDGGIDMIIDVSTAESRRRGPMGMREAGSVSMLGADSFSRSSNASSGARIYRPHREKAIDV